MEVNRLTSPGEGAGPVMDSMLADGLRLKMLLGHELRQSPEDSPLKRAAALRIKHGDRVMRVRGRELRYQAAIRGWDEHRLAQAAGVSQATVSRAMAGGHIHRGTLLRLARALHDQEPLPELKTLVDVDEAA